MKGIAAGLMIAAPAGLVAQDADGMDGIWRRADISQTPQVVLDNLPRGVSPSQILVKDRCYYFQRGKKAYPVTTPETGKYPYCIM